MRGRRRKGGRRKERKRFERGRNREIMREGDIERLRVSLFNITSLTRPYIPCED